MKKGTIVLTQFPFTDLTSTKRRPALVVSKTISQKEDVIVAFISSVIPPKSSETDLILRQGTNEFKLTGLKKDSIIKLDKLCTINIRAFSGELGEIDKNTLILVDEKLKLALDIK